MVSSRVAVIGAGPGGLAAALLLAAQGYEVEIFEARSEIGGRNGRLTLGEYSFDIGPTFFLMPHLLEEVFTRAGLRMSEYLTLKRLDPMYQLVFPDDTRFAPRDSFENMHKALGELSPDDANAFPRYYDYMDRKLNAILPILAKPYMRYSDLVSVDLLKATPYLRPERSLAGELKSFFKDERTQLSFGFQAKYLGMSPYKCPSLFSILNFIEQKYGVWHPVGGLNQIPKALAQAATDLGAKVHLDSPVTKLNISGRSIESIEVGGTKRSFDHYVVNADLMAFLTKTTTEADRNRYSDKRIREMKYSCSTFMMYLGIDTTVDLPHHTVLFSNDYKRYLSQISDTGKLPDDPSLYICNASITDPTLAPKGKSAIYVLSPVSNLQIGTTDWHSEQQRYRQTLLRAIRERLGIDLAAHIEGERIIDPLVWRDEFNVMNGAVFSIAHTLDQLLIWRPRNKFEEFDNMYLVGGSTHPGSGLPTIFQSARIATDLITSQQVATV